MGMAAFVTGKFKEQDSKAISSVAPGGCYYVDSLDDMEKMTNTLLSSLTASTSSWWETMASTCPFFSGASTEYLLTCKPLQLKPALILCGAYAPITTTQEPSRRFQKTL